MQDTAPPVCEHVCQVCGKIASLLVQLTEVEVDTPYECLLWICSDQECCIKLFGRYIAPPLLLPPPPSLPQATHTIAAVPVPRVPPPLAPAVTTTTTTKGAASIPSVNKTDGRPTATLNTAAAPASREPRRQYSLQSSHTQAKEQDDEISSSSSSSSSSEKSADEFSSSSSSSSSAPFLPTDDNDNNMFICSLCFEHFDESQRTPKLLHECGHTYCKTCIDEILLRNEPREKIPCPECKIITNFADCKSNFELIRCLRTWKATATASAAAAASAKEEADKVQKDKEEEEKRNNKRKLADIEERQMHIVHSNLVPNCEFCEEEVAEVYCHDCSVPRCLCDGCFKAKHKRVTMAEHNHTRIDNTSSIVVCVYHNELCHQFCKNCEQFLCSECTKEQTSSSSFSSSSAYTHTTHDAQDVNIAIENCQTSLKESLQLLTAAVDLCGPSLATAQEKVATFKREAIALAEENIHCKFGELRTRVLDALQRREQVLIADTTAHISRELDGLQHNTERAQRLHADGTAVSAKIQQQLTTDSSIKLIKNYNGLRTEIDEARKAITNEHQFLSSVTNVADTVSAVKSLFNVDSSTLF